MQHVKVSFAKCNLTATSAHIPHEGILIVKNTKRNLLKC